MTKKTLQSSMIVAASALAFIIAGASVALADSQVTGVLNTGLTAQNGAGVTGVVVTEPTANPGAGVYASAQSVVLAAAGSSDIYFTTDGSSPTCATGTMYSGDIDVSSSEVIQAVSCYSTDGLSTTTSPIAAFPYAINPGNSGGGSNTTGNIDNGGGEEGGGSFSSGGSTSVTGTVGIQDFVLLMANWGQPGPGNPADFSGDSVVGIQDFIWLMAHWNQ